MTTGIPAAQPGEGSVVYATEMNLLPGTRRRLSVLGIALFAAFAGLGLAIMLTPGRAPFAVDTWWMLIVRAARSPVLDVPAFTLDYIGDGLVARIIVPLAIVVVLFVLRKPWSVLAFAAASLISAGLVLATKQLVARPRPEDMLVTSNFGSYPSGHATNAATLCAVLGLLAARVWVWWAGGVYVVIMMISRTYLGAHWLSDTIGGLLLGVSVVFAVWAAFRPKLLREAPTAANSS